MVNDGRLRLFDGVQYVTEVAQIPPNDINLLDYIVKPYGGGVNVKDDRAPLALLKQMTYDRRTYETGSTCD
jgi:hypothetical protein